MILFLEVHDILWSKEINTQQRQIHISMDISPKNNQLARTLDVVESA